MAFAQMLKKLRKIVRFKIAAGRIQVLSSDAPFAIFINVLSCGGIKLYSAGESVNL